MAADGVKAHAIEKDEDKATDVAAVADTIREHFIVAVLVGRRRTCRSCCNRALLLIVAKVEYRRMDGHGRAHADARRRTVERQTPAPQPPAPATK